MADSNLEYSREMDSVIEDNYVYDSKTKSWTKREAGVLRRRAEGYRQSIDAFVKDAVTSDDGELSAKGTELFSAVGVTRCKAPCSSCQRAAGFSAAGTRMDSGQQRASVPRPSTKHANGRNHPPMDGVRNVSGGKGSSSREIHIVALIRCSSRRRSRRDSRPSLA